MKPDGLDLVSHYGSLPPGFLPRLVWKVATHRNLSRRTRKFIRRNIAVRYPGPFDVRVDGLEFRSYPLENYCDRTILGRGSLPEIPERELIRPYLKPDMVFVDIGANVGTYSLFVAAECRDTARVIAFEPHPRTFSKLQFNIKANEFRHIEAINRGVGPERGSLRLYSNGGTNIGTASLVPGVTEARNHVDIRIVVLPEALKSRFINHIDLLKIDVEGYEDRALLPLMRAENDTMWPRAILIETVMKSHWQVDCVARLQQLGYRVAGDTGENLLLVHPDMRTMRATAQPDTA